MTDKIHSIPGIAIICLTCKLAFVVTRENREGELKELNFNNDLKSFAHRHKEHRLVIWFRKSKWELGYPDIQQNFGEPSQK